MPVALGFHTQVHTQAALNQLLDQVQAERKRAVVVQGAQGRIITVLNKGNVISELLRSLTGQTRREAQRLEQFRASLPADADLQPPHAQVAQALADVVQPPVLPPQEVGQEATVAADAQAVASGAAAQLGQAQSPQATQAVAASPTGAAPVAQYVEQQTHNQSCFKHALAAYYNRPVFASFEDYLAYRNGVYGTMGPFVEEADFHDQGTSIAAVREILEAMRLDPHVDNAGVDTNAPWSVAFMLDVQRQGKPRNDAQDAQELDVHFQAFAQESASNRFIVNTGSGTSGHFWFISRDPATEQWTMANSTGKTLKQGPSPSRLLEQDYIRGGQVYIWTQLKGDPQAVNQRFSQVTLKGEPLPMRQPAQPTVVQAAVPPVVQVLAQPLPAEPTVQRAPPGGAGLATIAEEQDDPDDDLPPPILPPGFRAQASGQGLQPTGGEPARPAQRSLSERLAALDPNRPIDGVDLDFQRQIARDIEATATPRRDEALVRLNEALAQARHNQPARYAAIQQAIQDDLGLLARGAQPRADLVQRIQGGLQALDACRAAWHQNDSRLDGAMMNYFRAANGEVSVDRASAQDRAHRETVASLAMVSRRDLSLWIDAVQGRKPWPADWDEVKGRQLESSFRAAQQMGIADVACMPVWSQSAEEQDHARYTREVTAYLTRLS